MPEQFLKPEEAADVRAVMKQAKKAGAVSGGVFGSILKKTRQPTSDIDIVINDPQAPVLGEIEHQQGAKSGTWLHIFKKRPGLTGGATRREEILDTAETESKKLFGK